MLLPNKEGGEKGEDELESYAPGYNGPAVGVEEEPLGKGDECNCCCRRC